MVIMLQNAGLFAGDQSLSGHKTSQREIQVIYVFHVANTQGNTQPWFLGEV